MTVYFSNPGLIDLEAITIMGVNVKEGDNPIGFFGTGAKYAVAVLLRTGHTVSLRRGTITHTFTSREISIRGKAFNRVYLDEQELGFTTDLGRKWKVWQAYRELASNAYDEGGEVSKTPNPTAETEWRIDGPEIEEAYLNHDQIFLGTAPIEIVAGVEIHPGPSQYIYYRGIRVGTWNEAPTHFTYNIISPIGLTEDRTLESVWAAESRCEQALPACRSSQIVQALIQLKPKHREYSFDFDRCAEPSNEALSAIEANINNMTMPPKLQALLRQKRPAATLQPTTINPYEQQVVEEAWRLLADLTVSPFPFVTVETLGPGIYGCYLNDEIYISRQTIANGVDFLAATLLEEWLHAEHNFEDCTRALQQWLFDKLIAQTRQMNYWKGKADETCT